MTKSMSLLLETIRVENSRLQHLPWHQERLNRSRQVLFGCSEPIRLAAAITVREDIPAQKIFKCRLTYGRELEKIEFEPYTFRSIRSLRLTDAGALDYSHKFADRSALEALFLKKGQADDILLVKNGLLTDTFYTNLALFDGEKWLTPALPLLPGTCRARLLSEGLIREAEIRKQEIHLFKKIRLFNAMSGWENAWDLSCEKIY